MLACPKRPDPRLPTFAFDTGFVNVYDLCLLNLSSNLFVFAATGATRAWSRATRTRPRVLTRAAALSDQRFSGRGGGDHTEKVLLGRLRSPRLPLIGAVGCVATVSVPQESLWRLHWVTSRGCGSGTSSTSRRLTPTDSSKCLPHSGQQLQATSISSSGSAVTRHSGS